MSSKTRVIISIVISAVLLGMVVSYLIRAQIPSEAIDWVLWCAMVVFGFSAILRIALLAKSLKSYEEE